jgi:asparagine synthase (glutamine-hydrolysing)
MCGIAGIVSFDPSIAPSREQLMRMSAAMAHRGPDAEGLFSDVTASASIGFAFRRLAILDIDPRSNQPMTSNDGRYTIVFNGEIYNFRELRDELSASNPAYAWRTRGDAEVLLLAFSTWQERCLEKLNGMFAIAIWDRQSQHLFLARDRMGQKPLYLLRQGDLFAFASEVDALHAAFTIDRTLGDSDLRHFLAYGNLSRSTHDGARSYQLRPGTFCRVGASGTSADQYFDPGVGTRSDSTVNSTEVRTAVERAVHRQLVSDVPLGVFLSGGIDSSIVASCARRRGLLKTFSIGFDDPRYDESAFAREVATHLKTDHHEFRVTPKMADDLPAIVRCFGEPFADSSMIPTYYLCRETRRHVTVALSGDGGDELFGGYDRYVAMRRAAGPARLIPDRIAAALAKRLRGHPKSMRDRAARFLASLSMTPAGRFDSFGRIFDDTQIRGLCRFKPATPAPVEATFDSLRRDHAINDVRIAMATDRLHYLPDDLLTKVDRCSMRHALEVRSPFMDHELVDLARRLTTDQLIGLGKKRMLREAFANELPASVFGRPKMGFAVPIGDWFATSLKSFLADHLFRPGGFCGSRLDMKTVRSLFDEHAARTRDHSQRLFALLVLEIWYA